MSTVSITDVRVATRTHLLLLDNVIATDWEGDKFEPTSGTEYQSVYLLTGAVASVFLVFAIALIYINIGSLNLAVIAQSFETLPYNIKVLIFYVVQKFSKLQNTKHIYFSNVLKYF